MELEGTFVNGTFVLDAGSAVPEDGTRVRLAPIEAEPKPAPASPLKKGWVLELAEGLMVDDPDSPGDRAAQHDHYAHGAPKR